MFCPRCKAEYRAGFSKCSDCDIELVEQLPANPPHTRRKAEADHPELVVIRTYPTTIDAELAKSALESVGIESMLRSDSKGSQSPGLAFARGVELLVRADDVEAADDILNV
jgi:Putative prokaryotic signal transducing protein